MEVRQPFTAKGDTPEWKMIYDALLTTAEFGEVISYAQLDEVLGRRFAANRSPLYRARLEMGEARHRWLDAVPGKGYRVIEAAEHIDVAQKHKRRARKQLGRMVRVAQVTDISRLTESELSRFDSQSKINAALYMVAVHHERRITRIEEILQKQGMA